jgi:hypothetical protein
MSAEPQPADDGIVYDLTAALGAFDWRATFPGGAGDAVDRFLADLDETDGA